MKKINNPLTYLILIIFINILILMFLKGAEFICFTIVLDLSFLVFFIPRTKKYIIKNTSDVVVGRIIDTIVTYQNMMFDNSQMPEINNYCIVDLEYKGEEYKLLVYDETMDLTIDDEVQVYLKKVKNNEIKYQMDIEKNMFYGKSYKSIIIIEEQLDQIDDTLPEENLLIYHNNIELNLSNLKFGNGTIDYKNVIIKKNNQNQN
ncbi:MAG: hypothetical protein IJD92_02640 [Bacilli bacterium]|nr:hypothetical protein [Bacilli bacterium]